MVLVRNLIVADAGTLRELTDLNMPFYKAPKQKVLGFFIAWFLNKFMQGKHHDKRLKVLFVEGKVDLAKALLPYFLSQ